MSRNDRLKRGTVRFALEQTTVTACKRLSRAPLCTMTPTELHEETHLKVLRLLEGNPRLSQREVSEALGVSLGKTNFCLKALIDKGLVKVKSFRKSQNKLAYAYLLTPVGISEKSVITARFLKRKVAEYEHLQAEIAALQIEVSGETQ
jgi:EPS-associated MarR family transcriptional regulator